MNIPNTKKGVFHNNKGLYTNDITVLNAYVLNKRPLKYRKMADLKGEIDKSKIIHQHCFINK